MTTASQVLAGIETVLATAVAAAGTYGAPTIGTIDDNAEQILTPRRAHVVPVSDRFDVETGGGNCQRILTFDIVAHYPRAPADIVKMIDDAVSFELTIRSLPAALLALDPSIETNRLQFDRTGDFGFSDVATATWRCSIRYRRS